MGFNSGFKGLIYMKIKTNLQSGDFFQCHKILNTLRFGSKLFPSSGETTNPKIQLTKKYNSRQHNAHASNKKPIRLKI